jgi:parvulin-like peptidyl-prolyl isomerase
LINAELEYATAQRLLDSRDQAEARGRTIQWRIEQVTAAGGSEELARKKWAAEGFDFEERAQEEYRTIMRRLYYTKKEAPKIQVRQTDIRAYYESNRDKEFTTQSSARFRVIKVDFKRTGGREAARDKASGIEKRARNGEDFAKLASTMNDEPLFMQPFPEPFAKGAFAVEEVDRAVWSVENGQLTPLVETKDAFYLALLEKKEAGRTIPFEEAQDEIVKKLRMQQFGALRQRVQQQLRKDAIIRVHPQMLQVALDMAMQRYPTWRGGAVSAR